MWSENKSGFSRRQFLKASSMLAVGGVLAACAPAGAPSGANFGWSIMEGSHGYDGDARADLLLPAAEYSHDFGCSVTGGYVYRGAMPEWNGVYLYGDYCSGTVWGVINVNGQWQSQVLFETGGTITSFGQDESGEVYLLSDNGNVFILTRK